MADFDLSRAVPVDVPAAPSQAPAAAPLFDLNRSIPVNLPDEQIYVEQTGETVQAPAGSTNTLSQIWDKSLAKVITPPRLTNYILSSGTATTTR